MEPAEARSEKVSTWSFRITEQLLGRMYFGSGSGTRCSRLFAVLKYIEKIAWGWPEKQIKILRGQKFPLEYV